jgi:hypothetical protein
MEQHTTLPKPYHMYDGQIFDYHNMPTNKLFATFTELEGLDQLIETLTHSYSIMYNKMFVLFVKSTNEYVVTYNVEQANVSNIPTNTISLHRKKEFNVLYSLNGLNEIIKGLNGGIVDPSFKINWQPYKNSILLTQNGNLKILKTKIYKIVEI